MLVLCAYGSGEAFMPRAGSENRLALLSIALGIVLTCVPTRAAEIQVTTIADDVTANGNCTLREAVLAANADVSVDACAPGNGIDTIVVPTGTYLLTLRGADVTIGVRILLGQESVAACRRLDANTDDRVTVAELVSAVNNLLRGCPG
jgi:CSLREA domain-containing protein